MELKERVECFVKLGIFLSQLDKSSTDFLLDKLESLKIKIKKAEIKNNWFNGNLRAGNAKDLFFSLNGITYGPVSDKRKVIKNFKIDPQNIFNSLKINELKDSYLNSLLNKERTL